MAAKESSPSAAACGEYDALVSIMDKLSISIAADPVPVAQTLFARGLIPPFSVDKEKKLLASEIVEQVLNKVNLFPEDFEVFLSVMEGFTWLRGVANLIKEKHDEFKV